ncbi:uncharacterized protein At3g61260 isoform X2 [Brachypodium distachyon]|uniref:Remorin C-terminal domain-containing protein n=2 Tax=Brachypodium distachyon TaxID=15368 RepID=I1ILW4_BRADI|nr:uncharacterized protein At3g61260 isoform X2 [Brachypodium distachyon]XP_024311089.1 uncharacterized protein At3g61260 isoform X2 [Brachypodium distachyon]XP_024311090.1 uncharacterized protein At3g61260 isoform X2 [Brachypodium distachyon]KQJ88593.1 hypothetical protein BRADI_4g19697v3 [Brachypodium distachyon]KQJ88594.1 hypothetical protein BRADI_4g19697v3 [Brachypodium distachyon]KQJ88595.1 hypothetical protein BRADI_4g19697v3 [Brachypodium distachyon]|eukprot:XP_014757369.1 uncharacterized protein At3g61260 isoform X2 [Brachypodium distachyon]
MQAAARQVDDKECYSSYTTNGGGGAAINGRRKNPPGPSSRGPKPMPSKWDDAQKWLVGSAAAANAAKPRNSNADDRRLLSSSCSQNGRISCSSMDGALEYNMVVAPPTPPQLGEDDGETKNMDEVVRASVCLRDMGTEMTPIASKEPSRAATPLRASTPVDARSPVSSRSSTPARAKPWQQQDLPLAATVVRTPEPLHGGEAESHVPSRNSLESRAAAWDEAERAKFTARYKREEVKIQAWENHEKRKAEMEMKKIEMKAEQMKARAQERLANKLAAARRVAEEKRASAEAMLNEGAARTSEKADYIRRTGHLPSSFFSFSFRIPSLCG